MWCKCKFFTLLDKIQCPTGFSYINKKSPDLRKARRFIMFFLPYFFAGSTDTNERSFAPRLKRTIPSAVAKSVWSTPMPTFLLGWCCVPRWRRIIFPDLANCPPKIFIPRRLLCDSRLFFVLPSPALCAMTCKSYSLIVIS